MKLASRILFFISAGLLFVLGLVYIVIEVRMLIASDFAVYPNPGLGALVMSARMVLGLVLLAPLSLFFVLPRTKIVGYVTVGLGLFLFVASFFYKFLVYGQTGIDNYVGIAFIALTGLYFLSQVLLLIPAAKAK